MSVPAAPPDTQLKLGWSRFLDPHVDDRLIAEEGEFILDEIRRHWVTRLWPAARVLLGMLAFGAMPWLGHYWWLALALGLVLGLNGFWRMHVEFMDRFVVTNLRVYRVHGVLDQRCASMPLARVLDISMQRPFWGQIFGYANFVFENAAQDQGLREIHFVGQPDARLHLFQRVVISAGLTGRVQSDIADGG
ncbi:MAG: PH domain-containing protein [Micropruina sp.]|uniref:PH domain-containing protein n=1 Tax=Micropruina sp. TaxID=2737536 RepID=UPI0039E2BEE8